MTRANPARRARPSAKRGRPKIDPTLDPDRRIVAAAVALQAGLGLSQRKSIDVALALLEGTPITAARAPRGARRRGGILIGYQLRMHKSFAGRAATIRRKLVHADTAVVKNMAMLLRSVLPKRHIL
jgi:hypothetical protein